MSPNRDTLQGVVSIFMACLVLAPLGHINTLSNMVPYMVSYTRMFTGSDVQYSVSVWLSCGLYAIQALSTPISAALVPRLGYKPLLFLGCAIHNVGILATAVTLNVNFGAVIFTYAIMVGWGIGATYGLLLAMAASWFPKHRGLIVGICACGNGVGAIILTPIQTYIINPENLAVNNVTQMFENEEMLRRVPKCLYIIGGILTAFQIVGCTFVRARPEEEEPLDCEESDDQEEVLAKTSTEEVSKGPREVLRETDIYLFWTIMCLGLIPLTLITAAIKVVGQRSIPDDNYLSIVGTVGSIFNTLSRLAWGPIGDRLSFKLPLVCLNVFYGAVLMSLPFTAAVPAAGKYLYALWVVFMYLCIAGYFVLLEFGITRCFGHKYFAINYAIVFTAFGPGSITGALIVYFVRLESYLTEIFIGCGAITVCSAVVALFLEDKKSSRCCRLISFARFRRKTVSIEVNDQRMDSVVTSEL